MKMIGILGGMGPEATVDFYQKIIKLCQKKYMAKYDNYPPMVIYNLSIPNVVAKTIIQGLEDIEKVLPFLLEGIKKLEFVGSDFIVIPCNTAHYFLPYLRKEVSIPILSIIEETVKKVRDKNYKKVGLLATKTTIKQKLYEVELNKFGISLVNPDKESQNKIIKIIQNILTGKNTMKDKKKIKSIIKKLELQGVESIILGCTELPLIIDKNVFKIELFDATEILAEATVKKSYKG